MTEGASAPFGSFVPFEEQNAAAFVGRGEDVARLEALLVGEARVVTLTGPSGIGKTSLIRAGLTPALVRRGMAVVTLGGYRDLERELVRATSLQGIAPPVPGQDPADYLGRLGRDATGGLLLVLDHLEEGLAEEIGRAELDAIFARVRAEAGPRLRFLLSVDERAFARLEPLHDALRTGEAGPGRVSMTLGRLNETQVGDILERGAVQSGTSFESGLAAILAADICREGPVRPFDVQLCARALVDLRMASKRRYRRSGGPAVLPAAWLTDVCRAAGGALARRALLAAAATGGVTPADLHAEARGGRDRGAETLAVLRARGLLTSQPRGRTEVYTLAHPALGELVDTVAMADRARAVTARRALRLRRSSGERLRALEIYNVYRHLPGQLADDERALVRRSLSGLGMRVSVGAALAILLLVAMYTDSRRAYTLAMDPPGELAAHRAWWSASGARAGRSSTSCRTARRSAPSSPTPATRRPASARRPSRGSAPRRSPARSTARAATGPKGARRSRSGCATC